MVRLSLVTAVLALAPAAAVLAVAPARWPAPPPCPPGFERGAPYGRGDCIGVGGMRGLMLNNGVLAIYLGEGSR